MEHRLFKYLDKYILIRNEESMEKLNALFLMELNTNEDDLDFLEGNICVDDCFALDENGEPVELHDFEIQIYHMRKNTEETLMISDVFFSCKEDLSGDENFENFPPIKDPSNDNMYSFVVDIRLGIGELKTRQEYIERFIEVHDNEIELFLLLETKNNNFELFSFKRLYEALEEVKDDKEIKNYLIENKFK